MDRDGMSEKPPPFQLHLGQIAIRHSRCWVAGVTTKFPKTVLEGFILKPLVAGYYESITVIRLKEGKFDPVLKEDILGYINGHTVDSHRSIKVSNTLFETDKSLVCQLKCNDHRGRAQSEAIVKLLPILGGVIFSEVGNKAEDGVEYFNAFFANELSWRVCQAVLEKVYDNDFLKSKSKLYDQPGLQNDPPLLAESLLNHEVKLDQHRKVLNSYLTQGGPIDVEEESWQLQTLRVLGQIVQKLPEYRSSIEFIIKMLFGMDVDRPVG
jgi:hypothetical protein